MASQGEVTVLGIKRAAVFLLAIVVAGIASGATWVTSRVVDHDGRIQVIEHRQSEADRQTRDIMETLKSISVSQTEILQRIARLEPR